MKDLWKKTSRGWRSTQLAVLLGVEGGGRDLADQPTHWPLGLAFLAQHVSLALYERAFRECRGGVLTVTLVVILGPCLKIAGIVLHDSAN